ESRDPQEAGRSNLRTGYDLPRFPVPVQDERLVPGVADRPCIVGRQSSNILQHAIARVYGRRRDDAPTRPIPVLDHWIDGAAGTRVHARPFQWSAQGVTSASGAGPWEPGGRGLSHAAGT